MKKIRVGILFGGKSAEHEISLQSAKSVIQAIDKEKYEVVLIGITKQGQWFLQEKSHYLMNATNPSEIALVFENNIVSNDVKELIFKNEESTKLDVIFPIVHGPFGEDGSLQGLLKLSNIPFVGAGVLGSAIGMDKDVMKRLLRDAEIPIAKFIVATDKLISFEEVKKKLGIPFFVKPANLGSSIGVSKVEKKEEFQKAIHLAFSFDTKVIMEEAIVGREVECSVLGNDNPIASTVGEIIVHDTFYTYSAKYLDEKGSELRIPAELPKEVVKEIQNLAIKTFTTLCCFGMARVDFFVTKEHKIFVNEINTIPGFTNISMYPKLWEASGTSYKELISKLISFAIEKFNKEKNLQTTR